MENQYFITFGKLRFYIIFYIFLSSLPLLTEASETNNILDFSTKSTTRYFKPSDVFLKREKRGVFGKSKNADNKKGSIYKISNFFKSNTSKKTVAEEADKKSGFLSRAGSYFSSKKNKPKTVAEDGKYFTKTRDLKTRSTVQPQSINFPTNTAALHLDSQIFQDKPVSATKVHVAAQNEKLSEEAATNKQAYVPSLVQFEVPFLKDVQKRLSTIKLIPLKLSSECENSEKFPAFLKQCLEFVECEGGILNNITPTPSAENISHGATSIIEHYSQHKQDFELKLFVSQTTLNYHHAMYAVVSYLRDLECPLLCTCDEHNNITFNLMEQIVDHFLETPKNIVTKDGSTLETHIHNYNTWKQALAPTFTDNNPQMGVNAIVKYVDQLPLLNRRVFRHLAQLLRKMTDCQTANANFDEFKLTLAQAVFGNQKPGPAVAQVLLEMIIIPNHYLFVRENQEEEDLILECRNKSRCNGPKFVKEMQNPSIYSNTSLFYGLQWEEECTKTNDLPGFAYDALEFIECEGGLQISRVFSNYSDEIKPEVTTKILTSERQTDFNIEQFLQYNPSVTVFDIAQAFKQYLQSYNCPLLSICSYEHGLKRQHSTIISRIAALEEYKTIHDANNSELHLIAQAKQIIHLLSNCKRRLMRHLAALITKLIQCKTTEINIHGIVEEFVPILFGNISEEVEKTDANFVLKILLTYYEHIFVFATPDLPVSCRNNRTCNGLSPFVPKHHKIKSKFR